MSILPAASTRKTLVAGDLRLPLFVVGAVLVAVLAPRALAGPHVLTFDLVTVYAIAAIGLNIIFGLGGLLSIAQAAVMAVGAYTLVLILNHYSIGMFVALVLASLGGAIASGITGAIAIRIRSHYFILASLVIAEGAILVITNEIGLTGGSNGLPLSKPGTLLGVSLSDPVQFPLVAVPVLALVWYCGQCVKISRFGIALHAIRSDEYLALAAGIPTHRCRFWATLVGGAFGGVAGGMLAALNSFVGPQDFGLDTAILLLLIVVFGGMASNGGTVLAAVVLTVLTQGLLTVTGVGDLVYGVAILVLLIFARQGLAGVGHSAARWAAHRRALVSSRTQGSER